MRKYIVSIIIVLSFPFLLMACDSKKGMSTMNKFEKSIKNIIKSKDPGYDLIQDKSFINIMDKLAQELADENIIKFEHLTYGHLDDDNIPEIVVFRERDLKDTKDEGKLQVYKFNGDKYSLLDEVSMNFDNTNYDLTIGKISKSQNGIYLNNQVGAHSGVTYGFILKEGKLSSILNEKKMNLISTYTDNEIKDITKDGVLEFSIYTTDPESEVKESAESGMIKLWYRWDGKDGANLVKIERENLKISKVSDKNVLNKAEALLESKDLSFINFLKKNKNSLSKEDNTLLIKKYIKMLKDNIPVEEAEIKDYFASYEIGLNHNHLFKKYGLSIDKLNNLDYLNREKVLNSEIKFKKDLIKDLTIGYRIDESNGEYKYLINYQMFIEYFEENILKEYRDYIKILALDTQKPYLKNGNLTISTAELAERMVLMENFKINYPYSQLLDKINIDYAKCLDILLYGSENSPNFDKNTNTPIKGVYKNFKMITNKYPHTYFSEIINDFSKELQSNGNMINDEIKDKYNAQI